MEDHIKDLEGRLAEFQEKQKEILGKLREAQDAVKLFEQQANNIVGVIGGIQISLEVLKSDDTDEGSD